MFALFERLLPPTALPEHPEPILGRVHWNAGNGGILQLHRRLFSD